MMKKSKNLLLKLPESKNPENDKSLAEKNLAYS